MLKIWGRVNSVNVKKALWACEELGLKYERIDAGMQYGVDEDARVPEDEPELAGADDRRRRLRAVGVARHRALPRGASTAPARSGPTDLRARADAERWMDWAFTFQSAHARRVLGPDPHAAGEARR